jgi:hypothetical protein
MLQGMTPSTFVDVYQKFLALKITLSWGYDATLIGNLSPTFRRNLPPSYSGYSQQNELVKQLV